MQTQLKIEQMHIVGGLAALAGVQMIMIAITASNYSHTTVKLDEFKQQLRQTRERAEEEIAAAKADYVELNKQLDTLEANLGRASTALARLDEDVDSMCRSLAKLEVQATQATQPQLVRQQPQLVTVAMPSADKKPVSTPAVEKNVVPPRRWYFLWLR